MAYRYITGAAWVVLTVLLGIGCAAEEPALPSPTLSAITLASATRTATALPAIATQTATAVPFTATLTRTVTPDPTQTPTPLTVAVPTVSPSPPPLPTSAAQANATVTPTPSSIPTTTPTAPPIVHRIGEEIALGELTVFVVGWGTFVGNELAEPKSGNTFVTVDIIVVNTSDAVLSIGEALRLSLSDDTGKHYASDPIAGLALGMGTVGGAMNPGERLRGTVVFEVQTDSLGLLLGLDSDSSMTRMIALGRSSGTRRVPSMLEGEREQSAVQVGQEAEVGEIVLVVVGWSELPGGFIFKPGEGRKGIAVELAVRNRGALAVSIATLVQTAVKDSDSRRYSSSLLATLASGGAVDGELMSGQTVRGKVGFIVPADANGQVFTFDGSAFGGGKALFDLGNDPVNVALPDR